jgi:hypothetical protein
MEYIDMARMILLLCVLGFVGCSQQDGKGEPKVEKRQRCNGFYDVAVVSDPPGARIEVNDDYVGDAPITIKMKGDSHERVEQRYIIRALPMQAGQYVQTKDFWYNPYGKKSNPPVPSRILFQMNLAPRKDAEIDVNIKQN